MTLQERVTVTRDKVWVTQEENAHADLQYRRINLQQSVSKIERIPFQSISYKEEIAFQFPYETIEFKENDEVYIVDRSRTQSGSVFNKSYINLQNGKNSSRKPGYEYRIYMGNNAKMDVSHIWIENNNGVKYLLGPDGYILSDSDSWFFTNRKTNADLRMDQYAQAVFAINR